MRRLLPGPPRPLERAGAADLGDLADAYAYPAGTDGRAYLRANMVSSADGAATLHGGSGGLGGPGDRAVLQTLRALADCVIAGSGTVASEGYGPVSLRPAQQAIRRAAGAVGDVPPIVVVSGRLDLAAELPVFGDGAATTIVLTAASAPADQRRAISRRADLIVAGDERVDLAVALGELAGRGLRHLLCEGGPGLLSQLVAAELLDELCLTHGAMLVGGDQGRILTGGPLDPPFRLRLTHLLDDDDALYARYAVSAPAGARFGSDGGDRAGTGAG